MQETKRVSTHDSLKAVSYKLFEVISDELDVNTAYVAQQGSKAMKVISSFNKDHFIVPEGFQVTYDGSHCRLIIQNDEGVMHTNNLGSFNLTKDMEVTKQLEVKGYLGVTLRDYYGNIFGTLCVMDKEEKDFTDKDIHFLKNMAEVLSYIIHLDNTIADIDLLSVPIIPIKKGLSILSLQGNINEERSQKILEDTLSYAAKNSSESFIIDLSQIVLLENRFPDVLRNLVLGLNIMGIKVMMTGLPPWLVKMQEVRDHLTDLQTEYVMDIESALNKIGYTLEK
ncbi:STAS domain-containing protein [Planomicrobium sp. Y74]|uniref:STAS domain-containing protein n=1 Tax=Planomicrobium sp. Y74 TaxID=2478977 RepID=UPI000EF45EA0|nr:STAS domain-containing protein [Planomicrobium sp. Y74]RLQ89854.1 STAS domain-containing protein [Planomicrobium sp. Y74]